MVQVGAQEARCAARPATTTAPPTPRSARVLDQWCEKEGRDPATLTRTINLGSYLKTDAAAAEAERRRRLAGWEPMAEMFEGGMLFGTPRTAVERVGQYFDAGASRVTIALRAPFDLDALRGYVEEVLPAFSRS